MDNLGTHDVNYNMPVNIDSNTILEPYRRYLMVLASVHLPNELRGKLDPADIVQQVFLRAATVLQSEAGYGTLSISAWLRKILANELVDVYRHYHRDKRDIGRELSIDADLQASASGMMGWLAADQTSPSAKATQNEQLLHLANALSELPETMRDVVVLKYCQGLTLADIATRLNKSIPSVASYLRRGLEQLRNKLSTGEPSDAHE